MSHGISFPSRSVDLERSPFVPEMEEQKSSFDQEQPIIPSIESVQNMDLAELDMDLGLGRRDFEMEWQLAPLLESIEKKIQKMSGGEGVCLGVKAFCWDGRSNLCSTAAKCVLLVVALGTIYPTFVGSLACLDSNRVYSLSEMGSSDDEIASSAAQGLGNMGQGITYLTQYAEFALLPAIALLLKKPYQKALCQRIASIYQDSVAERPLLSKEERDFLAMRANRTLSSYGGSFIDLHETGIDVVQEQIEQKKGQLFSLRNIIPLICAQIAKDAKNSSYCSILGKIAKSTVLFLGTAAASYPLAVGLYGCFKPFDLQDPNDLFSSDSTDLKNATLNYANLGHGLEYAVTGCVFAVFTLKSMMGSQYKTVVKELLDEAYDPFILDPVNASSSNLLYRRKQQELALYNC